MVLQGFWAYASALIQTPAHQAPAQLVLGLAVVAVALLLVAAIGLPVRAPSTAPGFHAFARRSRITGRPRLADPDAAGWPRPRAPGSSPAAA